MKKRTRNLKVFVKDGKRYRVVFSSPDKKRTESAKKMYSHKKVAIHYDYLKGHWLLGVR